MNRAFFDWLGVISALCWPVCFWWMHRISRNQDQMLKDLQQQAREVRNVATEEHRLMKEIHPKVYNIAESLEEAPPKRS